MSIIATFGATACSRNVVSGTRSLDSDHAKSRAMHGDEAPRQRRDQIRVRDDGERKHEVGNGERDVPRAAVARQELIDKAMRIAGKRHHQMPHPAVLIQGRIVSERMPGAHGDNEVLLVEPGGVKARRQVVGWNDGDVGDPVIEFGEDVVPRLIG